MRPPMIEAFENILSTCVAFPFLREHCSLSRGNLKARHYRTSVKCNSVQGEQPIWRTDRDNVHGTEENTTSMSWSICHSHGEWHGFMAAKYVSTVEDGYDEIFLPCACKHFLEVGYHRDHSR